ncbi:unnamed protein product [Caenorhabditis auriculariae]|uniref:PAP-associated domain-containing protein n=1 Tax=Caenorhabditis auriculariae TaxID=2777116 RepID=A0A8S1HDE2_9PELO|nr:unnamed protein product [Caenorhabditis auriculariae]
MGDCGTYLDADQYSFKVFSNSEPFHQFLQKYQNYLNDKYEYFDQLAGELERSFIVEQEHEEDFQKKMKFCKALSAAIERRCPKWVFNVVPTGSSVTGLAAKGCDLDITIHIPQAGKFFPSNEDYDRKRVSRNILKIVQYIINEDEYMRTLIRFERDFKMHYIDASIPLLRVFTKDGFECDIAVVAGEFLSSMHNTFLLRHFSNLDERFPILCFVVKKWATGNGVKNPKDGGFNSYALVLLVVHFLQCGTFPPILPNLALVYQGAKFFALSDKDFPSTLDFGAPLPRDLPETTKNKTNVAVLFLQFLHYYSIFDFRINYISIRTARVEKRSKDRKNTNKAVYIEDPLDEHNPGRTVRSEAEIREKFRKTLELFDSASSKFPTACNIYN